MPFEELIKEVNGNIAQEKKKRARLKDLDLIVLDNSLRESTVGQLRGHTLENKRKIYDEVRKCGFQYKIVAAYSHMPRVDDTWVEQIVRDCEEEFGPNTITSDLLSGIICLITVVCRYAEPLRICITGAAGQIAYSLLYSVCKGDVFGTNQPLSVLLLDIVPMMPVLEGVVMELQDCAFPLLQEVISTSEPGEAFSNIDVAILVGAMPRKQGMERKDLLKANAKIFVEQGKALNQHAKKTVKVLVVGNPANTNCMVAKMNAPSIPPENFTCLMRLDLNRAKAQ
ncbi:Malate dehydrogenase, cytoplasmic, partial [Stylophora pistillata]